MVFLSALDQTIVSTAAPSISADLHNAVGYTWIGGAYLLAYAVAGPIWAKFSDIWGRKPALMGSIALFAVASVIAAAAVDMAMLIAGRAMQGVAGGGLMQLVNITISDLFSMRKRALYLSWIGGVWVLAGTIGPLIGGALSEYASWRWCFWINLPFCGVAFAVILFFLHVHNPRTKLSDGLRAIDWFGTISILGVTLMLLLGLELGGVTFPWNSPRIICLIVFGALMIIFFLYSEMRLAKYPLILLGVFEGRVNIAIVVVTLTHSVAMFGAEYYLPLYFQSVKQASPLHSGLLLLPLIITCAIVDVLSGIFMHRVGRYRELIWAGMILLTLGTGLYMILGVDSGLGEIIGFQIVAGTGVALLFQTPSLAIQNNVSQADTSTAMATLSFVRSLGTVLSTVLGGVVFQNSMNSRSSTLAASGLSKSYLEAFSGYDAAANVALVGTLSDPAQRRSVVDAFAWSTKNMFLLYTCIAAVGVLAAAFIKHKDMSNEHVETKTGTQNMTERNT